MSETRSRLPADAAPRRIVAPAGLLLAAASLAASPSVAADSAAATGVTSAQVPVLAAVAQPAPQVVGDAQSAGRDDGYVYRIGAEDRLDIRVRGEEDLSRNLEVRPDGRITLPLIGDIPAVGKTPDELEAAIAEALAGYIQDPLVEVVVESATGTFSDRIRIIGEAMEPQSLPYRDDMTALSAMTEVGGLPPTAAPGRAYILRRRADGGTARIPLRLDRLLGEGRRSANEALEPGDVIVIPEGFFRGEWDFTPTLGVSQSYTDNVILAPAGQKDSALISELIPGFAAELDANRIQAAINASVRLQLLSETDIDDFSVGPEVAGTATIEILEDVFFTDLAASVTRTLLDTQRGISANNANLQNRRITQTYRVSPYFRNRLGDFATLEARYIGAAVLVSQEEDANNPVPLGFLINDSLENTGEVTVESGPRFSTLDWTFNATWSDIDLDNRPGRLRREASLRAEYALSSSLFLIAVGGYQNFEGRDFAREIDDPLGLGGFRWEPSANTSLEVTAGFEDGDETFNVDFQYQISEDLSLQASFDDAPAIDQQRLVGNLPGTIDDLDTFDPDATNLTLRGDPTRRKRVEGGLRGNIGTTLLTVNGSYEERNLGVVDGVPDEEVIQATASITQPLARDWRVTASGTLQFRDFAAIDDIRAAREDDLYFANAGVTYSGLSNLDISLTYSHTRRDSTTQFQDFRENSVTLLVSGRF